MQHFFLWQHIPAFSKRVISCPELSDRDPWPVSGFWGYINRTKSKPVIRSFFINRYASRLSRRARFLRTAFPYFRTNVTAMRLFGNPLAKKYNLIPIQLTDRPFLKTLVISSLLLRCSRRLNVLPVLHSSGNFRQGLLIGFFFVCNGKFIPSFGPAAF